MRTVSRSVRLGVDAEAAWAACMALIRSPDLRRGIVARRCEPDPPRVGASLVTVTASGGELVSEIVELDPGRRIATASRDDGPSVLTRLEVTPDGDGARVTLTSEATTALSGRRALGGVLDAVILGRAQRRSVRSTLRRWRELAAGGVGPATPA